MSIMDFFRGSNGDATPAAGTQGQQQAPQQQAAPQQEGAGNPTVPQQEGETGGEVSGLDAFKDIWNNEPDDSGNDNSQNYDPSSFLNVDPEAIQQAVAQVDFSQVLDRETLAQISEGGEQAQQAFAKSMNSIAQHVFSQSMIANATLVKQALNKSTSTFDARAQELMRRSQIDQTVSSSNPAFKHPSAAPIVKAMQSQLAQKYPQASPKEIADKANQWFEEFANEIGAPKRQQQQSQQKAGEMDWEQFFLQDEM